MQKQGGICVAPRALRAGEGVDRDVFLASPPTWATLAKRIGDNYSLMTDWNAECRLQGIKCCSEPCCGLIMSVCDYTEMMVPCGLHGQKKRNGTGWTWCGPSRTDRIWGGRTGQRGEIVEQMFRGRNVLPFQWSMRKPAKWEQRFCSHIMWERILVPCLASLIEMTYWSLHFPDQVVSPWEQRFVSLGPGT